MFRFVRWLLLLAVIAALSGFLLTYPMAGRTAAERVCGLAGSPACEAMARRWGAAVKGWEARVRPSVPSGAPARRSYRVAMGRQAPPVTQRADAPPLDRHTSSERAALQRILAQRGSR